MLMLHWTTGVDNVTVVRFHPFLIRSSFNNIFHIGIYTLHAPKFIQQYISYIYTLLHGPKFKMCEIGKIDPPFLKVKK